MTLICREDLLKVIDELGYGEDIRLLVMMQPPINAVLCEGGKSDDCCGTASRGHVH